MADGLLEEFIRQYIATRGDTDFAEFTWHGGEPTLVGLDFYRKVVRLQRQHAGGKRIDNALQTNGLLLDDAWCEFLHEHGFLVGLSIDGPKHLHDRFRLSRGGRPTFDRVYKAKAQALLQKHMGVPFQYVDGRPRRQRPLSGGSHYRFLTEDLGSSAASQ